MLVSTFFHAEYGLRKGTMSNRPLIPDADPAKAYEPLKDTINSMFSIVSTFTIAGTAFLYLAGETYLDQYQRSFGILFGAAETTTARVISQGYTVVFFALIEGFPAAAILLFGAVIVGISIGVTLRLGAQREWPIVSKLYGILDNLSNRSPYLSRNLLLLCLLTVVLCGAIPAGDYAAKRERAYTLQEVRRGAPFMYSTPERSVCGFPIAQDHNLVWLLNSDGLSALPLENLTVQPARKTSAPHGCRR